MKTLLTSISRGCNMLVPVLLVVTFIFDIYDRLTACPTTPVPEKPANDMNEQE